MARSREEIGAALADLVERYRDYAGTERGEAQPFLEQLLTAYGTDRLAVGARYEERTGAGFMDLIWPGICIVEMKRPSEAERLDLHREQAFRYWQDESRKTGNAGRYVVVCAFHRFEVFEPGRFYDRPVAEFSLEELPDRSEALDFLRGEDPRFTEDRAELTRDAVVLVTDVYARLTERLATRADEVRDFVLQCVWCMFAEDLGMIPEHRFSRIVEDLVANPQRSTEHELGGLFDRLNTPGPRPERGQYEGVPYVDGGLFREPAHVELEPEELTLLYESCGFDWKLVEPAIFGSLLEGALGRERVWAFGAHYTSEDDIRKVVEPTIVAPWRERIETIESLDDLAAAQRDFEEFTILDPACGSGNFLYVAYRELRRIEASLRARERELRLAAGLPEADHTPRYSLANVHGIELEPFAVKLARVTLWMAHKLAVSELDLDEDVLPLADLSGIRRADALKVEWPNADAIIGNPPYHGSQQIRRELGDEYAEWLKREFGIGLKDFAVYWFRKAHEALPDDGRAGLVATNSVSQGRSREASLQWIVETGGVITNAVSKRPWPGAAVVNVSIVNWVKNPANMTSPVALDGERVAAISSSLDEADANVTAASRLTQNRGHVFQGTIPAGAGFILDAEEAGKLLSIPDADYSSVVRPYLIGEDITTSPTQDPRRWIIDFGFLTLEEAQKYPDALAIVRDRVKLERDASRDHGFREYWWRFGRPRGALRSAIAPLQRYIAANRYGKRILFAWQDVEACPGDLVLVFAFDDDFSMGVLLGGAHWGWARAQSSTIRVDTRYTPTSAFETFPWPQPTGEQREAIAEAAREVVARRSEVCVERQIGLTQLYNEVDEGAYRELAKLHRTLDEAVAAAYGWPKRIAQDATETNRRLLELNAAIASGMIEYAPFGD
jgi:hypothetical protein